LDFPLWRSSGPALPEPRRPRGLLRPGRSPQRKVEGVLLRTGSDRAEQALFAQLADHRPPRPVRQLPVAAIPARVEIQRVSLVRIAVRMQLRRSPKNRRDLT